MNCYYITAFKITFLELHLLGLPKADVEIKEKRILNFMN
jgi:hypothetical protein